MNFETIFTCFLVLFSIIFSLIVRFVPKPLLETIFGGSKRQSMHKNAILEQFWDFRGPEIDPWSSIFCEKTSKNLRPRIAQGDLDPTWARFGAENGPRNHFHRFGVVLGRFWEDFEQFQMDFHDFSMIYAMFLGGIQAPIL